jgi:hypothetical protein
MASQQYNLNVTPAANLYRFSAVSVQTLYGRPYATALMAAGVYRTNTN